MNEREKRIWDAAYGAYFALDFKAVADSPVHTGWDQAEATTTAEAPSRVADLAVIRFREWRDQEDELLGEEVDE